MYFPILTAKQNEILALCELPEKVFANTIPILILPESKNLKKQLKDLILKNIYFILVVNSGKSTYPRQNMIQHEFIDDILKDYKNYSLAYIVDGKTSKYDLQDFFNANLTLEKSIIHYGKFGNTTFLHSLNHKFDIYLINAVDDDYINRTANGEIVYVEDGFKRRNTNKEYPAFSDFSDLIFKYESEQIFGFGDYNIIGRDVKDGGGSPYAIALHLSVINDPQFKVYHFISDDNDDQKDQAKKFSQAVKKLIARIDRNPMFEGEGLRDFRKNHSNGHYPGLGVCKRMSIKNHIEQIVHKISLL